MIRWLHERTKARALDTQHKGQSLVITRKHLNAFNVPYYIHLVDRFL